VNDRATIKKMLNGITRGAYAILAGVAIVAIAMAALVWWLMS
jgi:hypothetical protein